MTLLQRTQALEAKAKRQREQQVREEVAKSVRARTSSLEKSLVKLGTARLRAEALQSANHVRSSWPNPPLQAFAAYDPAATSPVSVESARQAEWDHFAPAFDTYVKKVEKVVEQDIKRAKKSALDGISADEIRDYQGDPSAEQQAVRLLDTLQSLTQRNWETLTEPELLGVLQRASAFREDVTRLRENGASQELRAFLARAARKDGAALDELTEALRAELKSRKLLARLRLVLR